MYERPKDRTNFDDVGNFHEKFGLDSVTHHGAGIRNLSKEAMLFRLKFLREELDELELAVGAEYETILADDREFHSRVLADVADPEDWDHEKAFDALLDEVYVAMGTAHLLGYPWQEGWDNVQRANMSKVRAKADGSDSLRGSSLDVIKPAGWTAPDHSAILGLTKEN